MDENNNNSIYHYTDFQSLEGILIKKEIWLGNLRYMNDRLEMKYFFESLQETIIIELPEYKDKIIKLFASQTEKLKGKESYACSLSECSDDANMWDRYAIHGRGVCIKFRKDALEKVLSDKAVIQPVYYLENMRDHQIKALIEMYLTENIIGNNFGTIDEVFQNAWYCANAFKHPSFSAEKEIRICLNPFSTHNMKANELRYIASKDGLREYVAIALCSQIERNYGGAIEEIILGPNSGCDINLFFRYLQNKLVDLHAFSITKSTCPLR